MADACPPDLAVLWEPTRGAQVCCPPTEICSWGVTPWEYQVNTSDIGATRTREDTHNLTEGSRVKPELHTAACTHAFTIYKPSHPHPCLT